MPHQELVVAGQHIPSVTQWLDVMDKKYLRAWYAKEELKRAIDELAAFEFTTPEELKKHHKAVLALWRKRVKMKQGETDWAADQKSKDAAAIGTEFHNCVEKFLKGEQHESPPELAPKVAPLITEFKRFHGEWKLTPTVGQELHVVSKRYVYQGTFDFLGEDCKILGLGLWDWKTSNKIDDTFGLQIALYAYAYGEQQGWTEDETWRRITHGGTVRLDKRTGYLEHKIYRDLPYLFRVASALREPYDYREQIGVWEADND